AVRAGSPADLYLPVYGSHHRYQRRMIRTSVRQRYSLRQLHAAASACGLPWVSYRLPRAEQPRTILQLEESPGIFTEQCTGGFVIAPFLFPQQEAYWLRSDLSLTGFEADLQDAHTG